MLLREKQAFDKIYKTMGEGIMKRQLRKECTPSGSLGRPKSILPKIYMKVIIKDSITMIKLNMSRQT